MTTDTPSGLSTHDVALEADCRHVAPDETGYKARMRVHQSWYRRNVLRLPPGPNHHARGEVYGSMLRPDDGAAGANFINSKAHAFVEQRLATDPKHITPDYIRNNLLASQAMCFNLFVPLALDLNLATRLVSALPGMQQVARVTGVRLEYAPPKEKVLNDETSFDAWFEYELHSGDRGFVAVETKLTEPFSQKKREFGYRYSRWRNQPQWWWSGHEETRFPDKRYNQLWRNHLLAFALLHQPEQRYTECHCALVSHPLDKGCRDCMNAYTEHLLPHG